MQSSLSSKVFILYFYTVPCRTFGGFRFLSFWLCAAYMCNISANTWPNKNLFSLAHVNFELLKLCTAGMRCSLENAVKHRVPSYNWWDSCVRWPISCLTAVALWVQILARSQVHVCLNLVIPHHLYILLLNCNKYDFNQYTRSYWTVCFRCAVCNSSKYEYKYNGYYGNACFLFYFLKEDDSGITKKTVNAFVVESNDWERDLNGYMPESTFSLSPWVYETQSDSLSTNVWNL